MEKVKKAGIKFLKTSPIYGIPRVFQTERMFMKVLWSLMILASVSFGLNVLINTFNDYSRREFITQVNVKEPNECETVQSCRTRRVAGAVFKVNNRR